MNPALFKANMERAIGAYRRMTATEEFREAERLRSLARHNEAAALRHAREEAREEATREADERWQGALADKDAALADKDAEIARLLGLLH